MTIHAHPWLIGLALSALLVACGGGGSSSTTTSTATTPSTSTSTSSTTTTSTSTTTPVTTTVSSTPTVTVANPTTTTSVTPVDPGTSVLTGVASIGAPLMGATVRIVDGKGAQVLMVNAAGAKVPSVQTSTADGSYRAVLATATPSLPLLIQAAGVDSAGLPVVLHSILNTTTLPQLSNISPMTDAVVAQVLGVMPQTIFANAVNSTATMSLLGSVTAVTSASEQLKTIAKTSFTDVKITDTKTVDFFRDETFRANKLGLDAVIEGMKIQVVSDKSGSDQLQLSNKFVAPGTVEVKIDLPTARAELLKGTTGSVLKAITSTTKVVSSPHKLHLGYVSVLDDLTVALNKMIAENTSFASSAIAASVFQNGRTNTALKTLLGGLAAKNNQLGRFQVIGCVDDPIPVTGCTKMQVSALVVDAAGRIQDSFTDTVAYSTVTTPAWTLVGNGRMSDVKVYPAAQVVLNADGTLPVGSTGPTNGLQLVVMGQDPVTKAQALQGATVQVPSGFSVLTRYCSLRETCVTTVPAPGPSPVATGDLSDTLIQKPSPGWVGSQDAVRGAKFVASVTLMGTATETLSAYLPADVPSDMPLALFPKPDAATPLTLTSVGNGFTLAWTNWLQNTPHMRVFNVRLIAQAAGINYLQDIPVDNPVANAAVLAPVPGVTAFQVWLGAVDYLGRRYYSQLKSAP